jgi:NhaA family Na+:H+ antiporter
MSAPEEVKMIRRGTNSALRNFLKSEASGGILLMVAAALAMVIANSSLYDLYHNVLEAGWGFKVPLGEKLKEANLHLFVNDALMAIFFFLVGLEIKREFVDGRLATWADRRMPVIAAACGMIFPAIVYLSLTSSAPGPDLTNGWAIPAATDIAFAIGVLALLGKRAPASLKLFLVTVAIVDDMGAVAIIALFYSDGLSETYLIGGAVVMAAMFALNRMRVQSIPVYLVLALILWVLVLLSGVHATIAGVLAALMIPITKTPGAPDSAESPLHKLEHVITPWSAYFIIPIFGFANAGVHIGDMTVGEIFAPLPLGIAAGLFIGKQIGIFGSIWLCVKAGFASRMTGASWLQIYAVCILCGIGFTMSLFIGELAFSGTNESAQLLRDEAKIGILMGSILSALVGYFILRFAPQKKRHEVEAEISAPGVSKEAKAL